jgi:hypothetical protein
MLIDQILPEWDFRERHASTVRASPERALRAAREVTAREAPLFRALIALRGLPARLFGERRHRPADRPILEVALAGGFLLLAEELGRELVVGTIGQFWRATGAGGPRVADAAAFLRFREPGFTKAVMNFHATDESRGRARLSTETRIQATDERARLRFALYWTLVRPGSGLIRREWLRAARRRAERA